MLIAQSKGPITILELPFQTLELDKESRFTDLCRSVLLKNLNQPGGSQRGKIE